MFCKFVCVGVCACVRAWVCVRGCVRVRGCVCVVPEGKQFDYTLQCSINKSVKIVITVTR